MKYCYVCLLTRGRMVSCHPHGYCAFSESRLLLGGALGGFRSVRAEITLAGYRCAHNGSCNSSRYSQVASIKKIALVLGTDVPGECKSTIHVVCSLVFLNESCPIQMNVCHTGFSSVSRGMAVHRITHVDTTSTPYYV